MIMMMMMMMMMMTRPLILMGVFISIFPTQFKAPQS